MFSLLQVLQRFTCFFPWFGLELSVTCQNIFLPRFFYILHNTVNNITGIWAEGFIIEAYEKLSWPKLHNNQHWSESQFFPWETFISMRNALTICETIRAGCQSSNPWHKSQHSVSSSGHYKAFQDSSSCRRPFSRSICRGLGNFWLSDIKAFCNL